LETGNQIAYSRNIVYLKANEILKGMNVSTIIEDNLALQKSIWKPGIFVTNWLILSKFRSLQSVAKEN
jgi:hypothetical protein